MSRLLEGKVCLVTGSARGIGRAITEKFASEGATVYANAKRDGSVDEWLTECSNRSQIIPLYFDVSIPGEVKRAVARIKQESKQLDVLVNNAGLEFNELIGMISRENMEKMFNVNVFGMIEMIQMASRIMMRQENGGSIINISSLVGIRGNKGQFVYSATKGAVNALTKSAAKELAEKGIRVNAIAPGLTKTGMMNAVDEEKLKNRIANIALGRIAEPLDIANACVFFASDLSDYVSGQILGVDGCTIM
ncbi:SDR family NAD(P)-dependent oxidoreductase [Heyndrickxia sporothermodurans]|uniref:SDR family NAD(P)-dependent oxidoreductase n=1 Tax=Heyndrickxia sporothermodurans TaxID=46224 RepID=UPI002E1E1604|nr:SDR family NAD(P)-dependent oxidoreductase [Heyndrickxia sporothermodurans]